MKNENDEDLSELAKKLEPKGDEYEYPTLKDFNTQIEAISKKLENNFTNQMENFAKKFEQERNSSFTNKLKNLLENIEIEDILEIEKNQDLEL